ncbi:MAG TPA: hypothetical protein DCO68_03140 [Methylophilaceae bacterium]|nr:hypothetical protein [Methylophilaceae bacterium]HAJ71054.1 hypothetical protein [Methylophilaceae bacterium]
MEYFENLDYWRLCDELSLEQAACLIIGINPSSEEGSNCPSWKVHEQPFGYHAALTAITNALRRKTIKGIVSREKLYDINGNPYDEVEDSIIIRESKVDVESLKLWLVSRGFRKGFFFPEPISATDYLDPKNPRYAPKLALAVEAWLAVTDSGKKSPKQALEKWIREHAAQFGLVDDEGKPIEAAVEECSKVANWNLSGGAPKSSS